MLRLVVHLPDFTGLSASAMARTVPPDGFDPAAHARAVLEESARVKRAAADALGAPIARAAGWIADAYRGGGKTLLFGNGGSASDAQHIAAEWTGKLGPDRAALPSIALSANSSDLTAIGNDYGFERIFARLVEAHGRPGDVAVAISTSGNSPNVIAGVAEARARGLRTIGLLGRGGGKLAAQVELALVVPSADTQRIQECHIAIAHAIAEIVDRLLFPELARP
jgi:D-sedoheptulose 7-phosphate isomerase